MGKSDSSSSSSSEEEKKEKKDKKTKKQPKPKHVLLTQAGYSKRYASFHNNKSFSDVTVNYPGGDSHPAHKVVLETGSSHIEKALETSTSFTFEKEVDDSTAKNVIKFLYTGCLEYSSESDLVTFMILANHLKIKNITEFKVPAKVYLNGIIAYVEKDLTSRQSEFDTLCESVDFKKMEKEDLTKIYAKKKWLQKSSSFLNQIILKDMSDGSDGSEKSGSESEEEEEEEEEDDTGSSKCEFDPKKSHTSYSYNKKTKAITNGSSGWIGTARAKKPTDKFSVKLISGISNLMFGFTQVDKYNQNASNYSTGHTWYINSSCLYGSNFKNGSSSFPYGETTIGTIYGAKYDKKKGEISFFKNGVFVQIGFDNLKKMKMLPIVDSYDSGASFGFVSGKFKMK